MNLNRRGFLKAIGLGAAGAAVAPAALAGALREEEFVDLVVKVVDPDSEDLQPGDPVVLNDDGTVSRAQGIGTALGDSFNRKCAEMHLGIIEETLR